MSGLFVTATGTGIGKTLVTGLIARQARAAGLSVRALKPVISGYDPEDAACDTHLLLDAQGLDRTAETIAAISPWRFPAPVSADMAARRAGVRLSAAEIAGFCGPGTEDLLLVEGIGGVMVPLNDHETVLDWIKATALPALLVTGSYLGALSHCLTAAAALAARAIPLALVVVSESAEQPVPLAETMATLMRFLAPSPVVALPRQPGPVPDLLALARL